MKFPASVIHTLEKLIRCFFWGKEQNSRYLAYISWEKITKPKEEGGLAIRDLALVNDAMLLKSLWKLASRENAQWISIVIAKYLPRSKLWHSARTYQCTSFWRGLMSLREKLIPMTSWDIGKGDRCNVFGEPWFESATTYKPLIANQGKLVVRDLVQEGGTLWNVSLLIQLFGHTTT